MDIFHKGHHVNRKQNEKFVYATEAAVKLLAEEGRRQLLVIVNFDKFKDNCCFLPGTCFQV